MDSEARCVLGRETEIVGLRVGLVEDVGEDGEGEGERAPSRLLAVLTSFEKKFGAMSGKT